MLCSLHGDGSAGVMGEDKDGIVVNALSILAEDVTVFIHEDFTTFIHS
jgi:hypothetical protein